MKGSASKIQLTSFNDLFRADDGVEADRERIQEVSLSELHPFKGHPFQVRDDEAMRETADSIAKYGVLVPGIVRPRSEGGYEIVAGHRRRRGSELAGKATMPVLIRTPDDDEATIIMVDSNLQREEILPSEKSFAYRMKLKALKHQGKRLKATSARTVQNLTTREQIARDAGEKSGMAVARYISLTKLIPSLLALVDEGKLSVSTAADCLSDLSEASQTDLVTVMDKLKVVPALSQLTKIKQHSKAGTLTINVIESLLSSERPATVQVVFKQAKLHQYFPKDYTVQQMEDVIVTLLETWSIHHK